MQWRNSDNETRKQKRQAFAEDYLQMPAACF